MAASASSAATNPQPPLFNTYELTPAEWKKSFAAGRYVIVKVDSFSIAEKIAAAGGGGKPATTLSTKQGQAKIAIDNFWKNWKASLKFDDKSLKSFGGAISTYWRRSPLEKKNALSQAFLTASDANLKWLSLQSGRWKFTGQTTFELSETPVGLKAAAEIPVPYADAAVITVSLTAKLGLTKEGWAAVARMVGGLVLQQFLTDIGLSAVLSAADFAVLAALPPDDGRGCSRQLACDIGKAGHRNVVCESLRGKGIRQSSCSRPNRRRERRPGLAGKDDRGRDK